MHPRIEAVRKIIESEYQNNPRVPEFAKRAGISRSHLAFLFKKETGLTPKACLRDARLRQAAELLSEDHLSIKQAAFSAGYFHGSSFGRAFKEHFGKTPSKYRRDWPTTKITQSGPTE
jgi:two-component system, response regulator YesN